MRSTTSTASSIPTVCPRVENPSPLVSIAKAARSGVTDQGSNRATGGGGVWANLSDHGMSRSLRLAEGLAGAAMTYQFLLEESPWLPLALLVVAAVIAWARRSSSILVDMLRR